MSETYNPQRKLRMISEIKRTDDTSVTTGEHLTKGKRRRLDWIPVSITFSFLHGMDIKVARRSIQIPKRHAPADPLVSYR